MGGIEKETAVLHALGIQQCVSVHRERQVLVCHQALRVWAPHICARQAHSLCSCIEKTHASHRKNSAGGPISLKPLHVSVHGRAREGPVLHTPQAKRGPSRGRPFGEYNKVLKGREREGPYCHSNLWPFAEPWGSATRLHAPLWGARGSKSVSTQHRSEVSPPT